MTTKREPNTPIIIKKYANRRLYDTGRSSYVTLEDLKEMVQKKMDFVVQDAKTGDDITHAVLTQIIADEEANGEKILPTDFLRNIIGFYGDSMQGILPQYLQSTLGMFMQNQEQMREQMSKTIEKVPGMKAVPNMKNMQTIFPGAEAFEEISRKNMEIFQTAFQTTMEQSMKMFKPFGSSFGKPEDDKE